MKSNLDLKKDNSLQPKRKLKTRPLLLLIAILFVFNVLWFVAWSMSDVRQSANEEVASIAGKKITREQWMTAMEKEIGEETLLNLVNEKVMEEAAKQHGIKVSEKEINLEVALIHSVDGAAYSGLDEETIRQKIKSGLILEKVLSKDVVLKEKTIKKFYDDNELLYNIAPSYRTAILVVQTKEEAEQSKRELEKGSGFDVLAKERSNDPASASLGGDIGYINQSTDTYDKVIIKTALKLKADQTSDVVKLADGNYALVHVSEVKEGQTFTYEEVKDHIQRELALEQLPQSVNPEAFWKEFDVEWFYEK